MSEMVEIVDSLEHRLTELFSKIDRLEDSSKHLKQELARAANIIQKQSKQIEAMQKQYETLKIANSLLGSDENKRDTKFKINSLIREIDYCIAQLSD
jgi:chromosome segregation ATPase